MAYEQVMLTCAIDTDGEDHHLPGRLAEAGEVLFVKKRFDSGTLHVGHCAEDDQAFIVYANEYTTIQGVTNDQDHENAG